MKMSNQFTQKLPHIGKYILKKLSDKGIKKSAVAPKWGIKLPTLYGLEKRFDLRISEIILWSELLEEDLFLHYTNPNAEPLVKAAVLEEAKAQLTEKTARVAALEKEVEKLKTENELLRQVVFHNKS
jgi:hypothetical protein